MWWGPRPRRPAAAGDRTPAPPGARAATCARRPPLLACRERREEEASMHVREILKAGPVIPVVTIDDAARAPGLARALLAGGIRVVEVTMRTPAALEIGRAHV